MADPRISHGLAEGEKLVQCPYESSHLILGQRMDRHILRCRHNYEKKLKEKGEKLVTVTCAYHPYHFCVDVELAYHQGQCPYKFKDYKQEIADLRASVPKRTAEDLAHAEFAHKVAEDELWDDEDLRGDREPRVWPKPPKADRVSFFVPQGRSKSEKLAYRKALIQRNNAIVDNTFVKVRSADGTEDCTTDVAKLKILIENKLKLNESEAEADEGNLVDIPEDCNVKFATQEEIMNAGEKKDIDASAGTSALEPENFFTTDAASVASPNEVDDEDDDEFWDARSTLSTFSTTK